MAEEGAGLKKKLEEQLNCSICLDTYTDPKLLQCFHVYCHQCLMPLVVRDQQGQLGITCPTCRHVTPIPDRGVAGLQSAFHINRFLEILENPVTTLERPIEGTATNVPPRNDIGYCLEHTGEELKLYCGTCDDLVCLQCILKHSTHHDHDCVLLTDAFKSYKRETTSLLDPVEKKMATVKKVLTELDKRYGEISDQQAATEDCVHSTFKQLREVLDVRENELISQLDQLTKGKLKSLAAQRDQIETSLAQLNSCLNFMRGILEIDNEHGVLTMKTNTLKQVEELIAPLEQDMCTLNTQADITYLASSDMTMVCQNYGQISVPCLPEPSEYYVTGKGLEVAAVGERSTVTLQLVDLEGHPRSLECKLTSQVMGTAANCSVQRRCQYEIAYQPTIKGRHQLHIKAESQHIRGSPFNITVKSTDNNFSSPILTISDVGRPWGLAVQQATGDHELVVTEGEEHCVSVFRPDGEKIRSFGTHGSGEGEFEGPLGVATDREGNILVADSGNNRILKFTAYGQFLMGVGTNGNGPLQFHCPTDIAFNAGMNLVYVVDGDNHRIQVLNSDLTFSHAFGKKGSGKGQFSSPWGIDVDTTGKVYVADSCNHRIQVFTAEGKFLRMFGRRGQGKGQLDGPCGVAIDASGMVYVSEGVNCRISVFTLEGQFVTLFGKMGEGPGEFGGPRGLAVDNCGVVYVCDHWLNAVQVF